MTPVMINVDGTPTLFSPVHARTLEPGDRFAPYGAHLTHPTRIVLSRVSLVAPDDDELLMWADHFPGTPMMASFLRSRPGGTKLTAMPSNLTVLRAVGGRPARGGAR